MQGAKYGYIWAGSNLACLAFFFLCVPETKGRTLEEINELFAKRVSVRDFRQFETTVVERARRTMGDGGGQDSEKHRQVLEERGGAAAKS